jgi:hypothetical protein
VVQAGRLADFLNVCGLKTFGALGDVEGNFVTFGKGFETVALDGGEMYENVFATFLLNETETFCVVKPFNLTLCHFPTSLFSPVLRRNMCDTA